MTTIISPFLLIPHPDSASAADVPADLTALVNRLEALAGGYVPLGASISYAGAGDPAGGFFLLEDGRALNSTADPTLAALYTLIGTTYGGTGANNFFLPDSRGASDIAPSNMGTARGAIAGTGSTRVAAALAAVLGEAVHLNTDQESGIRAHSHGVTDPGHAHTSVGAHDISGGFGTPAYSTASSNATTTNSNTTGITIQNVAAANAVNSHNTVHPVICKNKIIRVR